MDSIGMLKRAVIVFSGGQDSTTCLIQAIKQYDEVHCITFNYAQRHSTEIVVAQKICQHFNIKAHKILDVGLLNELAISSLTRDNIPIPSYEKSSESELPNTFVPGRNILFLTLAAIYAYQVQAEVVITGVCETDFSGYPDCRDEFVKALNQAICLGIAKAIRFETPLMWLNKAETWALADYYHSFEFIQNKTLTCYNGIIGDGCQKCAACHLRAEGLKYYLNHRQAIMSSLKQKMHLK